MKKISRTIAFTAFTLLSSSSLTYSQYTYIGENVTTNPGTYTDLGTNGTVITTSSFDNANSAPVNIGFSFVFGCNTFTQFILNTNGFIKMGNTPPSKADFFYSGSQTMEGDIFESKNPQDVNIIAPFNMDLTGVTGAEYRIYTQGTAPSRVTTIQYKNLKDATTDIPAQYNSISFQIKLYEGSNDIEFVYGNWTASTNAPNFKSAAVGLKAVFPMVMLLKFANVPWDSPQYENGDYTLRPFLHRKDFLPDAGRRYKFVPSLRDDDIAVTDIYALGSLPINYATQPTVSARLWNNSCSSKTFNVALDVSGAETYANSQSTTIPAESSRKVNFTNYNPTVEGTNTIIISIPDDGNNANNNMETIQEVTQNNINYAGNYPTSGTVSGSLGLGSQIGILMARYIITGSRKVNAVNVGIGTIIDTLTIGKTMYAVVMDEFGTILGRSDNWTASENDLGKYHTFQITNPPTVNGNSSFFVGLALTEPDHNPVAYQFENNWRTETFFISPGLSGGAFTEISSDLPGKWMMGAIFADPVGINETTYSNNNFSVYPNPSHGLINLQVEKEDASPVEITILDLFGKRCHHEIILNTCNLSEKTVDVSHLSNGVYLIKLKFEGQEHTEKFILSK